MILPKRGGRNLRPELAGSMRRTCITTKEVVSCGLVEEMVGERPWVLVVRIEYRYIER